MILTHSMSSKWKIPLNDELDDVQNMLTCWAVEKRYFNCINIGSVQLVAMHHI